MGLFNRKVVNVDISEIKAYQEMLTSLEPNVDGVNQLLRRVANLSNAIAVSLVDVKHKTLLGTSDESFEQKKEFISKFNSFEKEKHTMRFVNEVTLKDEVVFIQIEPIKQYGYALVFEVEEFDAVPFDLFPIYKLICYMAKHNMTDVIDTRGVLNREDFICDLESDYDPQYECTLVCVKAHDNSKLIADIIAKLKTLTGRDIYYLGNGVFIYTMDTGLIVSYQICEKHLSVMNSNEMALSAVVTPYDGNVRRSLFLLESMEVECGEIYCLDETRRDGFISRLLTNNIEGCKDANFKEV